MDWEDLKLKSKEDLKKILQECRVDLQSLLFQARGRELKQFHKITDLKKQIARVRTLLKSLEKAE